MAFETSTHPSQRKQILRVSCIVYLLALLPAWFFTSIGNFGLGLAVWLGCVFVWKRSIRQVDKEVLADKAKWEALLARRDSLMRKAQMKIYPETPLECFSLLEEIDEILGWSFADWEINRRNLDTLWDYREQVEQDLWRLSDSRLE
ncbi:hypothetical protein [Pseudomonas sp. GM33]|uniref:hypothetical protein n=1 Tax=Pseudomonas sp. GM33 TaxID=1144329 RepID=UPI000517C829|nr:hypothetical protein [Pseudomonas sp. GM33]